MYDDAKNKNYKLILNENNVSISEYIDKNDLCWFKCKFMANKKNIIKNITNIEKIKKDNIDILNIKKNGDIYHYHLESPASLLGIPEQEIIFDLKINKHQNIFVDIKSVNEKPIYEDVDVNKIKLFTIEQNEFNINEVYIAILPSQKIIGNKHLIFLRKFLYSFFISLS